MMSSADRRQQITQAASELFTSRRFNEITVDNAVQGAHVGKGRINRYLRDEHDLFFRMAGSGFDETRDGLHRKVPEQAPFLAQQVSARKEIVAFLERKRQVFK